MKPLQIQINELKENLVKVLNESELHIAIKLLILKDININAEMANQKVFSSELDNFKKEKEQVLEGVPTVECNRDSIENN